MRKRITSPIRSDSDFLITHFDGRDSDERIKNFGFTKETVQGANNPVMIEDFFTVVADHINKMSLYNAFAAPIQDFKRVYNYKRKGDEFSEATSVQVMLKNAMGDKVAKYIEQFISDLNGQTKISIDESMRFLNQALANYKKAAIGGNIRVGLQQPTAIIRAANIIDPQYFSGFKGRKVADVMKEMHDHCPIAEWKALGNFQIDMTRDLEAIMMNNDWSYGEKITMGAYGKLDDITWTAIWQAVKNETVAKHPNVEYGSDEFWELCNERASYVFDHTQVVDSVFHRSQGMRSKNDFMRLLTSFKAEPTRTFNMMRTDFLKAKEMYEAGDEEGAKKLFGRTLAVFVANALVVSAFAAAADALRGKGDDDKEKNIFERWWLNFIENSKDNLNIFSSIYVVGDIIGLKSGYGTTFMPLEGYESLMTSVNEWEKLMKGESKKSLGKVVEDTMKAASFLSGQPLYNMYRDFIKPIPFFNMEEVLAADLFSNNDVERLKAEGNEDVKELDVDYGSDPTLIKDGTTLDNVLNKFGFNLSVAEKKQKERDARKAEVQEKLDTWASNQAKKGIKVTDDERDAKLWSLCASGYKQQLEHGNIAMVQDMRDMYLEMGGSEASCNEKIAKVAKSAYKQTIGVEGKAEDQQQLREFMQTQLGVTDEEISEICYKSETSKKLKAACRMLDSDMAVDTIRDLMAAGMSEDDIRRVWDNRNRGDVDKYLPKSKSDHLIWPCEGVITSEFGSRTAPTKGASSYHEAIDIGAANGTPVGAAQVGTVKFAGTYGGYGNQVVLVHPDGSETYYSHLSAINVSQGDTVVQGQNIGAVGSTGISTGPHLDFKVRVNGSWVNPMNYLNK